MSYEADLIHLPLRAIVAFAARCARRVQPLYRRVRDDYPGWANLINALDNAIVATADFARGSACDPTTHGKLLGDALVQVQIARASRAAWFREVDGAAWSAARAAEAAVGSAHAAELAWTSKLDGYSARLAVDRALASAVSAQAAVASKISDAEAVEAALAADVRSLHALELSHYPELGRPIDPSEQGALGPLWIDGAPQWYMKPDLLLDGGLKEAGFMAVVFGEGKVTQDVPPLAVYIDPGEAPSELIAELYATLSALYRVHGGSGLQIAKDERRLLIGEEVGL